MKRVSGYDAFLLYSETPNVHMHTLKVAVVDASDFDGEFTFDLFRRTMRQRLPALEPLCYRLEGTPLKLHHPVWLEGCALDLDYHLRRAQVSNPGDRRELDRLVGQIGSVPLDRSRPLWELHFVEGMADNRFAIIAKIHHALADGGASANLMARGMDSGALAPALSSVDAPPQVSTGRLLRAAGRDHVHQLAKFPKVLRDTAAGALRVRRKAKERGEQPARARAFHAPATFINHALSPVRTFASATLSLLEVKETSKHLGITINDLVLAMSAGALRTLLLCHDGAADEPIVASVPVNVDPSPHRLSGNVLGTMFVSLPVQVPDRMDRVRLTSASAGVAKENYRLLGPEIISRWMAYLPPMVAPAAFRWVSRREARNKLYNIAISNVPGPREHGRFAGATISEFYSVGPVTAGSGLNITVWSYVDQLNISVIADDRTLGEPHEATDAMTSELIEIRRAAGLSDEVTQLSTAMAPAGPGG